MPIRAEALRGSELWRKAGRAVRRGRDPRTPIGQPRSPPRPPTEGGWSGSLRARRSGQGHARGSALSCAGYSSSLAFWLRSCRVAECVGDAVEQRGSEFLHLWRDLGREETPLPPDLAADSGERVGEGWALLAIPSSRRDRQTLLEAEPGGQERDQGEQPEQTRRRTGDGQVRPLALGLDAEVVTHVPEGDFHLPALDEPGQDLQRIAGEVGAEERLGVEAALGV